MRAIKLLATLMALSALGSASGCLNLGEWSYSEIRRVKAPDGVVDAVLVEGNGGATTSFSYSVFLVPSGTTFDPSQRVFEPDYAEFVADHQVGLELVWTRPKLLEIRFEKARIFEFSNFWHSREVQNFDYVVELRLVPLDSASSLIERDRRQESAPGPH